LSVYASVPPALRAAAWMGGALTSFIAMAVSGRVLSADMGIFQLLFCRSVVGLVVVVTLLSRSGWHQLHWRGAGWHGLRNTVHFAGQFGWFYGLAHIPLGAVIALEFTAPIWTALMAALLLGERFTTPRVLALALGFGGMLLILRPGMAVVDTASLAVLAAAFCYAMTYILTKRLVARGATPLSVLFWMTAVQLPMALLPALPGWQPLTLAGLPWIVVLGVTALSAHYCLSRALSLADASVVIPLDFLRLPLAALVGWAVWGEQLEWFVFAGGLLMLAGNLTNLHAERKTGGHATFSAAKAGAAASPRVPPRAWHARLFRRSR